MITLHGHTRSSLNDVRFIQRWDRVGAGGAGEGASMAMKGTESKADASVEKHD